MELVTGQKAIATKAKKSVANFKIREMCIRDSARRMKEEEKEIIQEEKARKHKNKKADKRKVRTGGFVDEIDVYKRQLWVGVSCLTYCSYFFLLIFCIWKILS